MVISAKTNELWVTHGLGPAMQLINATPRSCRKTGALGEFLAYERLEDKAVNVARRVKIGFDK